MHFEGKADVQIIREMIGLRAQQAVGVRFRLHGRSLETGLDCVGLTAYAIKPVINNITIPRHYTLRFDNIAAPQDFFANTDFSQIDSNCVFQSGDIILVAPSCQQLHFLIKHSQHYVHAHSALRRIVETNDLPFDAIAAWRYKGD